MRCARKRMSYISCEPAHDRGAKPCRHRKRQPLPQLDKHPKLWIERVQIGDVSPRRQAELVDERRWFEPPIAFEIIGSGAALASPEVEQAKAALAGAPHDLPVHEVIRRQAARVRCATAVIRQDFI